MRRALLIAFASITGCAATQINFSGERLLSRMRGELDVAHVRTKSRIEVDQQPALVLKEGDRVILEFADDATTPNATLYVALDEAQLAPHLTLGDGDFIPYVEVRAPLDDARGEQHAFVALCKGGRGRIHVDSATKEAISGHLAIAVSCRTYVDGYEREETSLELSGPFFADR